MSKNILISTQKLENSTNELIISSFLYTKEYCKRKESLPTDPQFFTSLKVQEKLCGRKLLVDVNLPFCSVFPLQIKCTYLTHLMQSTDKNLNLKITFKSRIFKSTPLKTQLKIPCRRAPRKKINKY